ncbi:MAG: hypothetical protein JWL80_677 [Parcubacteria group bacterium]|nr:hypothetical protein [Parcubacteria group bacterium]
MRLGDFFLHGGAFVALYASLGALLTLLFTVINAAFPPVNPYYSFFGSSISFEVAVLIVFFPIFLVLSWILQKRYAEDPSRRESSVRKFLIYFTLFVAGLSLAGDLVVVIYSFLNGEDFTTAFILKALSILVISGGVFFYYLQDVRNKLTTGARMALRVLSLMLILGAIIWGFSVLGSPRTQRNQRVDAEKLMNLQTIQSEIISNYQSKGVLAPNLASLKDSVSYFTLPTDPDTKTDYEYKVTGPLTFELCTVFNTSMPDQTKNSYASPYGMSDANSNWKYQSGHYCFQRQIDPQLYPVYNKPVSYN